MDLPSAKTLMGYGEFFQTYGPWAMVIVFVLIFVWQTILQRKTIRVIEEEHRKERKQWNERNAILAERFDDYYKTQNTMIQDSTFQKGRVADFLSDLSRETRRLADSFKDAGIKLKNLEDDDLTPTQVFRDKC